MPVADEAGFKKAAEAMSAISARRSSRAFNDFSRRNCYTVKDEVLKKGHKIMVNLVMAMVA